MTTASLAGCLRWLAPIGERVRKLGETRISPKLHRKPCNSMRVAHSMPLHPRRRLRTNRTMALTTLAACSDYERVQPLTRRALAKRKTRRALLDAAKRLFNERGYEAATVRGIAA